MSRFVSEFTLWVTLAFVAWLWSAGATSASEADELGLESLAFRGGFSGVSPLGKEHRTGFRQLDLAVTVRLPWEKEAGWGWVVGTRVLGSAGLLRGAQENNGIVTLVPLDICLCRRDGSLSIDMGGGGAVLSDYKFGKQDFGGPFQFVWTFGITSRFAGPFGAGYHFQHYSDATLYGRDSRGVDLHLFEFVYWFGTER